MPWVVALVCLAGVWYVGAGLKGLQSSVQTLIAQELTMPDELQAEWRWQGILITVTTKKREAETAEAFAQRHLDNVTAALAKFPKDP